MRRTRFVPVSESLEAIVALSDVPDGPVEVTPPDGPVEVTPPDDPPAPTLDASGDPILAVQAFAPAEAPGVDDGSLDPAPGPDPIPYGQGWPNPF